MKPRLRPHVEVTRQRYRGRRWYVVHDPTSNQFYRLNPVANDFVGMLDGHRSVEEAWKASLAKFGDAAPTQNEVITLISQLYNANLMTADTTPETEQLLRRGRERTKKKVMAQAVGIMYLKIKLFNPDPMLRWLEPIVRPLLNKWVFLVWLAFVAWSAVNVLTSPEAGRLFEGFSNALDPANWVYIAVVWIVTKAIHESGHGLICRRFGGQVPEFGVMMLVLFPAPYVDASACWAFPSRWKRMAVGAGGMIFELTVAAIASWVWLWAVQSGRAEDPIAKLTYFTMVTASVTTVLFNANPLMRFDGYYILADLLEVPNMMQRSMKMLQYLWQKHVYRLRNLTPPSTQRGEAAILVVYGVGAMIYRVFLFLSITLFLVGKFFVVGVLLAVWTAAAWFVIPVGKFVHWLATGPVLGEHRGRTIGITLACIALGLLTLGVIPMPDHRRGWGVIESRSQSGIYVKTDGFVDVAHVKPGDAVKAGDPIVTMSNPELEIQRVSSVASIEELQIEERAAIAKGETAAAQVAQERLAVLREGLDEIDRKLRELVVVAPHDGVIVGGDPTKSVGAYLKRGVSLCGITDPTDIRVAASMDQINASWLLGGRFERPADDERADEAAEQAVRDAVSEWSREEYRVAMRLKSDVWEALPGASVEAPRAGQRILPHEALGFAGGGLVEVDTQDQSGRLSKRPRFTVYVTPSKDAARQMKVWPVGERVRLRFTLTPKPLLEQWIDRLMKTIQGRADV